MSSWSSLTSGNAYKSPAFIALVSALCVAILLLLHHCAVITCCHGGDRDRDRRRRQQQQQNHQHHRRRRVTAAQQDDGDDNNDDDGNVSVEEGHSATHLVVCRYRKEESEAWSETTCPVCLADFADGDNVRVLPECLHYFHADCIDTWLRGGSTSCPMCRADTTPSPSPVSVSVSVSLEEILVRS